MDHNDQAWAVFRCSLLKPVLLGEIPKSERGSYYRMLSEQEHLLPNSTRKKISTSRGKRLSFSRTPMPALYTNSTSHRMMPSRVSLRALPITKSTLRHVDELVARRGRS